MSCAVIIPSKTAANLIACVGALTEYEPLAKVVVIDDGIGCGVEKTSAFPVFASRWVVGQKPFIFSRAVNQGIRAVPGSDIILLNDDALLKTAGGFTAMQRAAQMHPEYGLLSAVTDLAGNVEQRPQGTGGIRDEARTVAFVCVFIPATTLALVGAFDERFTAYGWEDNDYCRRVRNAGLKLGIFDGCFVDHSSLTSTFRGDPRTPGDIHAGGEIYRQKWGDLQ